jgi:hypothetical protein
MTGSDSTVRLCTVTPASAKPANQTLFAYAVGTVPNHNAARTHRGGRAVAVEAVADTGPAVGRRWAGGGPVVGLGQAANAAFDAIAAGARPARRAAASASAAKTRRSGVRSGCHWTPRANG